MDKKEDFTLLPVRDDHNCFACGPANPYGLHMRFSANEDTVVSRLTVPEHLRGWSTMVHGGIISTILDEIMSWAAIHLLNKIIVTRSMTVDFKKALYVENELRVEGKVVDTDNRREATIEGAVYNSKNELCAAAIGTFTIIAPAIARRLGIINDEEITSFFEPLISA